MKFSLKFLLFIQENLFSIVVRKMSATLPQCVSYVSQNGLSAKMQTMMQIMPQFTDTFCVSLDEEDRK